MIQIDEMATPDRRPVEPQRDATFNSSEEGTTMKKIGFATLIAGGLSAAVLGLAAPASAEPATPAGPHYSVDNHDQVNTTNGFVDLPF
ncbi:hypothetical protein [Mycolicibacterium porcinum]|uniref:hypothetical protein n=1 Tax=Mycolicibacterium porcinum TaxID=39693 RepID=UPI0010427717|nr:hypothetical protein [Mycolicibacterium porcinum]